MNEIFEKVYRESGIKDRKDIKFELVYDSKNIYLRKFSHTWGGCANYEIINVYPFTMNVDDIINNVKETIAEYEPITGSHMSGFTNV